jgi:hypothetical protein
MKTTFGGGWIPWGVTFAALLEGCGATGYTQVRRDASQRWGCAQSEIEVESQGGDVVRASGCGKTSIYVCPSSEGRLPADPHAGNVSEEDARFGGGATGECRPR